jgi:hypothetical protein
MRFVLRGSREKFPLALSSSGPCDQAFSIGTSFRFEGREGETRAARRKKAEQMSPKGLRRARQSAAENAPAKRLDPRGRRQPSTVPESAPYDTGKNF